MRQGKAYEFTQKRRGFLPTLSSANPNLIFQSIIYIFRYRIIQPTVPPILYFDKTLTLVYIVQKPVGFEM